MDHSDDYMPVGSSPLSYREGFELIDSFYSGQPSSSVPSGLGQEDVVFTAPSGLASQMEDVQAEPMDQDDFGLNQLPTQPRCAAVPEADCIDEFVNFFEDPIQGTSNAETVVRGPQSESVANEAAGTSASPVADRNGTAFITPPPRQTYHEPPVTQNQEGVQRASNENISPNNRTPCSSHNRPHQQIPREGQSFFPASESHRTPDVAMQRQGNTLSSSSEGRNSLRIEMRKEEELQRFARDEPNAWDNIWLSSPIVQSFSTLLPTEPVEVPRIFVDQGTQTDPPQSPRQGGLEEGQKDEKEKEESGEGGKPGVQEPPRTKNCKAKLSTKRKPVRATTTSPRKTRRQCEVEAAALPNAVAAARARQKTSKIRVKME